MVDGIKYLTDLLNACQPYVVLVAGIFVCVYSWLKAHNSKLADDPDMQKLDKIAENAVSLQSKNEDLPGAQKFANAVNDAIKQADLEKIKSTPANTAGAVQKAYDKKIVETNEKAVTKPSEPDKSNDDKLDPSAPDAPVEIKSDL